MLVGFDVDLFTHNQQDWTENMVTYLGVQDSSGPPGPGGGVIPEPITMLAICLAFGALGGYACRRRTT